MSSRKPLTYRVFQFTSKHEQDWVREFTTLATDLPRAVHIRTGATQVYEAAKSLGYEVIEDASWPRYVGFAYEDKK